MEDFKDLEFLAGKSREFIDKQISAYRQKHSNSGTVIAIIALFIPFFLNGLNESYLLIKIFSIAPVCMFIYAVKLFLEVLKSKSLDQGFHVDKFDYLVNLKDFEKVLLYEIGANRSSFKDNEKIINSANNCFNLGIRLTLASVILSISILVFNNFFKPQQESKIQKVQLINFNSMADKTPKPAPKTTDTPKPTNNSGGTIRDIPVVPPTDRTNLHEHIRDVQIKKDTGKRGE